jgi:hypothetical protein
MTSKDEILAKLHDIAGEITHARESLLTGKLVPIENINARIDNECAAILEIDPDDAVALKPVLDALLLDLKTFSDEIDYVQNKVTEILAEQENRKKDGEPS